MIHYELTWTYSKRAAQKLAANGWVLKAVVKTKALFIPRTQYFFERAILDLS
jgi:hypothetical protein